MRARPFLEAVNPLATIGAVLPAILLLVFTRDILTPALFIVCAYVLLLTGTRLSGRRLILLLAVIPGAVLLLAAAFSLWTAPSHGDPTVLFHAGPIRLTLGAALIGTATALRLMSIVLLALITGLSSTGPDLVRSAVAHLHLPYRIGYAALASYRFVPRFRYELDVIRKAHRVRGAAGGRGPIAALRRTVAQVIPLLASAIRHADRVSLSMDSRAFGAHATRTERHSVPLRRSDVVFVAGGWLLTVALAIAASLLR